MTKAQNNRSRPTEGYFYAPGVLATLEETAAALRVDAYELADRCDREADLCGDVALIQLDGGITGFRTGGTWRFRFPISRPVGGSGVPHAPPAGDGR
jgi:hypothetical protein